MIVTLTHTWPEALPLPRIDYSGSVEHGTITSSLKQGNFLRRSRFEKSYQVISVSWTLNISQYELFEEFFEDTLGTGVAKFGIELRHPKNSELTEWMAQFAGEGYSANYVEGFYEVDAELFLHMPTELPVAAAVIRLSEFMVESEESGEDPISFVTSDEFSLNVQEE